MLSAPHGNALVMMDGGWKRVRRWGRNGVQMGAQRVLLLLLLLLLLLNEEPWRLGG